jgi:hypothetical protein
MSEIKVNKISPKQTCTQLTLGDSGDTIIIPAGATITNSGTATGFGRTGTVDWDTTVKTTGFTAVNGVGYFVNTTAGAITVTLPASPAAGNIVAFKDYAKTWDTNNLILSRNGSNIEGDANNYSAVTEGLSIALIYVDATKGWIVINSGDDSNITPQPLYVAATGGTVLTCGNFKTHVFTGPGTFTVTCAGNPSGSNSVEYLVVAGGAGGGGSSGSGGAGGGGAGGFRQNYPSPVLTGLPVSVQGYPITVGGGGPGGPGSVPPGVGSKGSDGVPSVFSTITSTGGGGGGLNPGTDPNGSPGGSAGGGGYGPSTGGTGNTPPVSPSQGNNGGSVPGQSRASGGGGGAGAVGGNGPGSSGYPTGSDPAGAGGVGSPIATTIFGPTAPSYGTPGPAPGRYFAGGGGGSVYAGTVGAGGSGGGGAGGNPSGGTGVSGTINTGGGGGSSGAISAGTGGAGGSGIVVIRYKFQ